MNSPFSREISGRTP